MSNRFQHSSLSQTMTAIKRHYAARSTGRSGTPYTPYTPPVVLTLTGPDTITRGDAATYTASITPKGLTLDATPTFNWKYTTTVRKDRDPVSITESIDATSENPKTTAWSGTMVSGGTLEVSTTVNGTKLVQTMDVTVNKRAWATDVPICTDTTSLGVEAPQSHSDLGNVEYDILFSRAHDLETAKVISGPNKGILYTTALNLKAPLIVKINRHFRMTVADLHPTWVAFKNANTLYGKIEAKVKARLGFDGTTNGTLYGDWVSEIGDNDPEANIEKFMEVPSKRLPYYDTAYKIQYEDQIVNRVEGLRKARKDRMDDVIRSGWSPYITINYNYFAAHAGRDQTVKVGSTVKFDGSGSVVPQGRRVAYTWNFGDGNTGYGVQATHTYTKPGAKIVTLTVADSGGKPYSDEMIVTVKKSLKRHPDIPVGMMGIQDKQLPDLEETFQSIYVGDKISTHPACNYLHSYGLDFNTTTGWGLRGVPLSKPPYERHAIAWANFVGSVKNVNHRLGGAKLKCLISNRLMHMRLVLRWRPEDISRYVQHTIEKIDEIRPTRINPNP
ncbi:MAG: PKD domain-containing protein, partial [Candidatus Poribacteria bacterium]|nr:PKD domain-containing protein [Candidatus Poribacteria bacterium]